MAQHGLFRNAVLTEKRHNRGKSPKKRSRNTSNGEDRSKQASSATLFSCGGISRSLGRGQLRFLENFPAGTDAHAPLPPALSSLSPISHCNILSSLNTGVHWPASHRYDDLKSAQENIDLQSTILSRFDLIFIVKDPASREMDLKIARHVLDNHRMAGARSVGVAFRCLASPLA